MISSAEAIRSGFPASCSHGLHESRDAQVRHAEPGETGFRLRAAPGRALVAELAPGAGGRAGERRDRRRVVVRLDLRHVVRHLLVRAIPSVGVGEEALRDPPFQHGRVVGIREDRALRIGRVRRADHPEEGVLPRLAVDDPRRVEDLVPAVLRVRLREHRQLDVGRVAREAREHLRRGSRSRRPRARARAPRWRARSRRARRRGPAPARADAAPSAGTGRRRPRSGRARSRSSGRGAGPPPGRGSRRHPRHGARCRARRGARSRARSCARCRSPSRTTARWCRSAGSPGRARCRAAARPRRRRTGGAGRGARARRHRVRGRARRNARTRSPRRRDPDGEG